MHYLLKIKISLIKSFTFTFRSLSESSGYLKLQPKFCEKLCL